MAEQVHPPEGLMEHPEEHPEVRHEFSDVSFRWIVGALMTAGVLGAVIHFAIGFFFEARKEALDVARRSPYPLAPRPSTALPPEPRLEQLDRMKQRTEPITLDKGQANLVRLGSLGPTEDKDFVHIPIERALRAACRQATGARPTSARAGDRRSRHLRTGSSSGRWQSPGGGDGAFSGTSCPAKGKPQDPGQRPRQRRRVQFGPSFQWGATSMKRTLCACLALALATGSAAAQPGLPAGLRQVRFEQRLDAQVPLAVAFKDEAGNTVRLADLCHDKPVILVFSYFRCPMLCHQVLNGLVRALLDVPFDVGKEFNVITISFDARETPEMAAIKKKTALERYGRPGAEAGWHFLTGQEEAIKQVADAAGFKFSYDAEHDQFAHAAGIVLLTPTGKISRYFYDIRYSPRDLRLGLVEASANRIGSASDQILLYCFHYDPIEGKYGPVVMSFVRIGGCLTLLAIGLFVFGLWRRERRRANPKVSTAG